MRAVLQRAAPGRCTVDGEAMGEIEAGLVVFAGIDKTDTEADLAWVAEKVAGLRLFADAENESHFARSLAETGGAVLAIPQFTLHGDARKGRRPSFDGAMRPPEAARMFDRFVEILRAKGIRVETGRFGAMMRVDVSNDGPVTVLLDSKKTF